MVVSMNVLRILHADSHRKVLMEVRTNAKRSYCECGRLVITGANVIEGNF